jgi:hypothetical protein
VGGGEIGLLLRQKEKTGQLPGFFFRAARIVADRRRMAQVQQLNLCFPLF